MTRLHRGARYDRGAALIFAMALVLILAVVGAAAIRYAARDRIDSAKLVVKERALTCAEAGLQYGRRLFGCNYKRTQGWNDYLSGLRPGRYDPSLDDVMPTDIAALPLELRGDADDDGKLDPGTDLDGDGKSDFWVSIRDDDDERALGAEDNRKRDNNLTVILRAECTNPAFATDSGNVRTVPVIEAYMTYVQGSSGYGTPSSASNSNDAATRGNWVQVDLTNCD